MASRKRFFKRKYRRAMVACLRRFLGDPFWKKGRQKYADFEKGRSRWSLKALFHVGLWMSLEPSPVAGERFERAIETYGAWFPKRRRCGETLAGYQKALSALPRAFLGDARGAVQRHWMEEVGGLRRVAGWLAFGFDGTKVDLPRTEAHAKEYGLATKVPAAAQLLVGAAVTLGEYALWDWGMDSALGSERELALQVIRRLPPDALTVLDAGFVGYEWARTLTQEGRAFLARVGSNVRLWVEKFPQAEWKDGEVWLWPNGQRSGAPVVLRLIRIAVPLGGRRRGRRRPNVQEMWLVTNVLEPEKLTSAQAAELYRKRWPASEGGFRSWKQTLGARKVMSRTPAAAEREVELSLIALAVLVALVSGARKQRRAERRKRKGRGRQTPAAGLAEARPASVAGARRVWRRAVRALAAGRSTAAFEEDLAGAVTDSYRRRRPKQRQRYPARKQHRWPKKPILRKLSACLKRLGRSRLEETALVAS